MCFHELFTFNLLITFRVCVWQLTQVDRVCLLSVVAMASDGECGQEGALPPLVASPSPDALAIAERILSGKQ